MYLIRSRLLICLLGCWSLILVLGPNPAASQSGQDQEPDEERIKPGGAPPAGSGTVEVNDFVRVIDGETVEVSFEGSRAGIGLIGIDAPQGNTTCGREATDLLQTLVGSGVRLEEDSNLVFDDRERRMYYAYTLDGQSIAKELVKAGVARAQGGGQESKQLAALESTAQKAKKGCLWGEQESDKGQEAKRQQSGSSAAQDGVFEAQATDGELSTSAVGGGFAEEVVAGQLNQPTAFAFLPDGRILIAEKSGTVRVQKDDALLSTPFIDISNQVNDYWDRGLLGIAADPNFTQNGFVYLLLTYEDDPAQYDGTKTARVIRVTASGDTAAPSTEKVLLGTIVGSSCNDFPAGTDCIPSDSPSHTVGNLKFATDGSMFVTTGDGANFSLVDDDALRAQNLDLLGGKVLHVSPDGDGLTTNPFFTGDANANRSKVWAYGMRNPYRFNLRPGTDVPYLGDVGWGDREEINVASKGANLGWPCYEGSLRQAGYEPKSVCQSLYDQGSSAVQSPLVEWRHSASDGSWISAAATGGAFYSGTSYPAGYHQDVYFYGDYAQGWIRYVELDENNQLVGSPTDFVTDAGGPVDIEMGADGNLYYLAINTGELRRITYGGTGGESNCPSGQYMAEYYNNKALSGPPDLERCETAIDNEWGAGGPGNGVGTDDFSVRWTGEHNFEAGEYTFSARSDDGVRVWVDDELIIDEWRVQGASTYQATRTLTAGEHEVKVEYFEASGDAVAQVSWQENITNQAPVATISEPSSSLQWKVGDIINFSGAAEDSEDGTLPSSSLTWKVLLHHCPGGDCHTHPFIEESGTSGSFTAPDHSDETYFEIILTATDSGGKKDTASVEIHPKTVQVTLDTSPTGLQVVYGGEAGTAPLTRTAIVGSTHTIYTPSPQGDFEFESWSDDGAAQHNVRVGATDATYTATFKDITPPTVRATNPKARATGVRRGTNITATFNKAMDPVTLVTTPTNPSNPNVGTSTTFTLTRAGYTTPVPAVVTLSADGKTVWLNPTNRLRARTWYRVKIIGAKDLAGNTLPNKAWSFKTRS